MREPAPPRAVIAAHPGRVPPPRIERVPLHRVPVRQALQPLQHHHRRQHRRGHRPAPPVAEQVREHLVREQPVPLPIQHRVDRTLRQHLVTETRHIVKQITLTIRQSQRHTPLPDRELQQCNSRPPCPRPPGPGPHERHQPPRPTGGKVGHDRVRGAVRLTAVARGEEARPPLPTRSVCPSVRPALTSARRRPTLPRRSPPPALARQRGLGDTQQRAAFAVHVSTTYRGNVPKVLIVRALWLWSALESVLHGQREGITTDAQTAHAVRPCQRCASGLAEPPAADPGRRPGARRKSPCPTPTYHPPPPALRNPTGCPKPLSLPVSGPPSPRRRCITASHGGSASARVALTCTPTAV